MPPSRHGESASLKACHPRSAKGLWVDNSNRFQGNLSGARPNKASPPGDIQRANHTQVTAGVKKRICDIIAALLFKNKDRTNRHLIQKPGPSKFS